MANQQSLIGNGNCFLLANIDGFLGSFIYDLLFTKMWHSLDISFVAMNLTAHLAVENAMLHKFLYFADRREQFRSGTSYSKFVVT